MTDRDHFLWGMTIGFLISPAIWGSLILLAVRWFG